MAVTPRRGDVVLVALDPTRGSEIRKTRPCVIVSPDELNRHLRTVIVAPMTTGGQAYPWRIACRFQQRDGFIAIDQLRTIEANVSTGSSVAWRRWRSVPRWSSCRRCSHPSLRVRASIVHTADGRACDCSVGMTRR